MIDLENIKELWYYQIDNENCTIDFHKIDIKSYKFDKEEPERFVTLISKNKKKYDLDLALSARYDNKYLILWEHGKVFIKSPEKYFFTKEDAQTNYIEFAFYWADKYEEELKEVQNKIDRNQKIMKNYVKKVAL